MAASTYALDGGVFAAGAMLEWLCKELGIGESSGARIWPAARRGPQRPACFPRLRGSAPPGGVPTPAR